MGGEMVVKCTKGIKSNQVARINILCVCGGGG